MFQADMAAMIALSMLGIDQLMKTIETSHQRSEDHAEKHIDYANVRATVAVGALEFLCQGGLE